MTADRQDVEKTIPSVKVKVSGLPIGRRRQQGQGTIFLKFFLKEAEAGFMRRRLHGVKTHMLRLLRCLKIESLVPWFLNINFYTHKKNPACKI